MGSICVCHISNQIFKSESLNARVPKQALSRVGRVDNGATGEEMRHELVKDRCCKRSQNVFNHHGDRSVRRSPDRYQGIPRVSGPHLEQLVLQRRTKDPEPYCIQGFASWLSDSCQPRTSWALVFSPADGFSLARPRMGCCEDGKHQRLASAEWRGVNTLSLVLRPPQGKRVVAASAFNLHWGLEGHHFEG